MNTPHILVVDDEKEITDLIEIYLTQEGYQVEKKYNAFTLMNDILEYHIDLVILDIMMPEIDGIHALKMIREKYNVPVIIVSAKTADTDKIEGLLTGADDYVSKPFNAMELVARVKSQLRRYQVFNKPINHSSHLIEATDLIIDTQKKLVTLDGKPLALTRIEYEILVLLASQPGTVFSIEDIFEKIWHMKSNNSNNTIMVHIRKLREKIERQPRNPRHIKTVWGVGYKFEL
ncbi:response regulator transcription factor [Clostridium sp. AUH-JLR23]|uniref:response regulator transcription factor n=1 Tax=Clostridium sp. AUH-JLR23 TaxID=1505062 RepID=UPI003565A018